MDQTKNEVIKLRDVLLKKFPQTNFILVAIDNQDTYKEGWNIECIKNFYIHDPNSECEWDGIFKKLGLK